MRKDGAKSQHNGNLFLGKENVADLEQDGETRWDQQPGKDLHTTETLGPAVG